MTVATAILSFILTGVIGNYLIQKWQLRNWLTQQKINIIEKEYSELRELAEEFSSIANERIFCMRNVLSSLSINDIELKKSRIIDYRNALNTWNQKYGYFCAKMPILMTQSHTSNFDEIHAKLVETSKLLDRAIATDAGTPPTSYEIEKKLTNINRASIRLTNKILNRAKRKRSSALNETHLPYKIENIEQYSTWHLIKALFIKDVNSFSVVRPPLEL